MYGIKLFFGSFMVFLLRNNVYTLTLSLDSSSPTLFTVGRHLFWLFPFPWESTYCFKVVSLARVPASGLISGTVAKLEA